MREPRLLAASLLLPFAALPAAATHLGGATEQVVIEATLLSVTRHELMELGIEAFRPGERIDAPTETQLQADGAAALSSTGDAISALQADTGVAGSPAGALALDTLLFSQGQQTALQSLLAEVGTPKAKQVREALFVSRGFQMGAIQALQARSERIAVGRNYWRDANALRDLLLGALPWLVDHGLPGDGNVLFEPFEVGRPKLLPILTSLNAGPGVRSRFRDGVLELSGDGKTPADGSADLQIALPESFTVLVSFALPERVSAKQREALEGFSAGVLVATDASADPAELFLVEHQTTPEGFAQTFTATSDNVILDVFPHTTPSLTRVVTTAITKDGDSLTLAGLLRDGEAETRVQTSVPVVGDLPVLGLYFRNGTKRTRLQVDDLFVFVTPQILEAEEAPE
jgi:hypothetical protein